jgi:hypothetical protein
VDMGEAGHRCVVGGIIGHASFELEALNTVSKEKVTLGYPPCNSFLTASGTQISLNNLGSHRMPPMR